MSPRSFQAAHTPRSGHSHFWNRAITRGQFLRATAGATGLALTSGIWLPQLAGAQQAGGADPKPIPGSDPRLPGPFHVYFPEPGLELATITVFDCVIGVTDVQGTGQGTNTKTGQSVDLLFDSDMR